MPIREYETKWYRVPDDLTAVIDRVIESDAENKLDLQNPEVRQIVEALGLKHHSIQISDEGQGAKAFAIYSPVYKNNRTAVPHYAVHAQENYKSEILHPQGLREMSPEEEELMNRLVSGHYGPAPAIDDLPRPIHIPDDFDPTTHIVTRSHILTLADLSTEVGPSIDNDAVEPAR